LSWGKGVPFLQQLGELRVTRGLAPTFASAERIAEALASFRKGVEYHGSTPIDYVSENNWLAMWEEKYGKENQDFQDTINTICQADITATIDVPIAVSGGYR